MLEFLFNKRARTALAVALMAAFILLLLWFGINVLFEIFAGILLAVFLRGLANLLGKRWKKVSPGWAYTIVVVGVCALIIWFTWTIFHDVASQVDKMIAVIPQALGELQDWLGRYGWGRWILAQKPLGNLVAGFNPGQMVFQLVDGVTAIVLIVFVGIYGGADPDLYRDGFLRLIPAEHRDLAGNILNRCYETLWWWLVGRIIAMTAVGVMNWIALSLLGVPLPLTLGLISGILTFIPNLGALIAVVPTALVALTVSTRMVLYVIVLHFILQSIEGYFITPFVQQRTIWMPPALLIAVQILAAEIIGFLGLTFAVPVTAIFIVLIKTMYIRDTLGERIQVPDNPAP